uniref:AIG1-type G domain-containing protein n=1 Tax=Pundamilia nyererei TaxID=303518 RepID=A0A3B4H9R0_9CICH
MESLTLVDRRVILIGLSGGGRSSAGNTILGSERFPTGCGFEPVPAEVVSGSAAVEHCWITVVDTPGFTARDLDEDQLEKRLRMMEEQTAPLSANRRHRLLLHGNCVQHGGYVSRHQQL